MADLIYGTNLGCAAAREYHGGSPGQCTGSEEFAVAHRYRYPKPHDVRLYVCAFHAQDLPGAEALTDGDRQVIAQRQARQAEQLARVTVGPYARRGQATNGCST